MSDTGNFRFNNTDSETLEIAAVLLDAGVKPYEMYVEIYENLNTAGRIIVLRHILEALQFAIDGKLAWASLDLARMKALGASEDDLHGLSDFLRSIKGVEIAFVVTRNGSEPVDVSMRSKGRYPVNGVAGQFGGGGHAFAAGCRINDTLEGATQALSSAFQEVLSND
jgi:phosphoesterase RecJ-like protein